MTDFQRIKSEEMPEGASLCPVCRGYKVIIQAAIPELPIDKPLSGMMRRCPCCYGTGWVVTLMHVRQTP